jgi:hypothetical protein
MRINLIQIQKLHLFLILIFVVLLFSGLSPLSAQTLFSVQYQNQAEVKVYVVKYESQADLKVYKVPYRSQAKGNEGLWFFEEHVNQAHKKIFFVKYENQADLKIFFVKYRNQAGWRNRNKIHLMY